MDMDTAMEVDGNGGDAPVGNLSDNNPDLMRETFKYFKRRKPPPDLSGVIDFDQCDTGRLQVSVNC